MGWEVFESNKKEHSCREFCLIFCEQMNIEIDRVKLYLRDDKVLVLVDKHGNVIFSYEVKDAIQ